MAKYRSKAVGDDEARPFVKLASLLAAAALPLTTKEPPPGKAGSEPPRVRTA